MPGNLARPSLPRQAQPFEQQRVAFGQLTAVSLTALYVKDREDVVLPRYFEVERSCQLTLRPASAKKPCRMSTARARARKTVIDAGDQRVTRTQDPSSSQQLMPRRPSSCTRGRAYPALSSDA